MACRYFIRGKLRSALTITAIAIGVAAVILIGSLGETGKALIQNELNMLGINGLTVYKSAGSGVLLNADDAQAIQTRLDDVTVTMPITVEYGRYKLSKKTDQAFIWGINENVGQVLNIELLYGRLPSSAEVRKKAKVALIEDNLAISAYARDNIVGKSIALTVNGKKADFEIIGIISNKDSGLTQLTQEFIPVSIYTPYTTLCDCLDKERIDQIAIACAADSDTDRVGQEAVTYLSRKYSGNGAAFTVQNIGSYKDQVSSVIGLVTLFLNAVAGISLCVAGFGIMNAMLSTTHERKTDIGIIMAMGAKRKDIAFSYLAESGIISAVGGLVGVTIGIIICVAVCVSLGIQPVIKPFYVISSELVAIGCGLLFGVVPANKASKLDPIQALRN